MRIELSDNTSIVTGIAIIAATICIVTAILTNALLERTKAAYAAGLEEINDTAVSTHYGHK